MVNNIKISLHYRLLVLFIVPSLLILKGFSLCHIYTSSVCSGPSLLMTLVPLTVPASSLSLSVSLPVCLEASLGFQWCFIYKITQMTYAWFSFSGNRHFPQSHRGFWVISRSPRAHQARGSNASWTVYQLVAGYIHIFPLMQLYLEAI